MKVPVVKFTFSQVLKVNFAENEVFLESSLFENFSNPKMSKTSIAGATSIGYTSNSYYENDSKTIWLTFFQSSKLNTEAAAQRRS